MFHERVNRPSDGFGDKTGVMMGMVAAIKELVMKCAMQPVVDEFSWSNMPPKHLPQSSVVVERKASISEVW